MKMKHSHFTAKFSTKFITIIWYPELSSLLWLLQLMMKLWTVTIGTSFIFVLQQIFYYYLHFFVIQTDTVPYRTLIPVKEVIGFSSDGCE